MTCLSFPKLSRLWMLFLRFISARDVEYLLAYVPLCLLPTSTSGSWHASPVGLQFSIATHAFPGLTGHFMVSRISLCRYWLPLIELRVRVQTQPLRRVRKQHRNLFALPNSSCFFSHWSDISFFSESSLLIWGPHFLFCFLHSTRGPTVEILINYQFTIIYFGPFELK